MSTSGSAGIDFAAWGLSSGYHDYAGRWRSSPPEAFEAVLAALGAGPSGPPPAPLRTVRTDGDLPDLGPGRLHLEGGGEIDTAPGLPPDLPHGYHRFEPDGGPPLTLVVSPGRLRRPPTRAFGFAAQLYASRSTASWGIGDFSDLARLGRWARRLGAGFTLVNPLHAPTPTTPRPASPYFPGSRCFYDPIYISVEDLPGAAGVPGLAEAAAAGRALNADRRIDRDRVWSLKEPALRAVAARTDGPHVDRYRRDKGEPLARFATFCAASRVHGPTWRDWPERAPSDADPDEVRFVQWLQWAAESQLAQAGRELGLVVDLAVGVDPSGPDAWMWRADFAAGMTVGAPPDEFNTLGQDWGLPPFDPWRLRADGYRPWIAALRSGLAHGAGLRVDHVMGLFRLFWIPEGMDPSSGVYVSYPAAELLDILALEAERAGAYVVGEDLGTVTDEARRALGERQVLSYRVWWFEERPPAEWPEPAMAAVTTHDLPTVAGVLSGSDLQAQRDLGCHPNEEAAAGLARKLDQRVAGGDPEAVIEAVYADLATAPCDLLVATLEDVLAVEERPNMPGTTDQWPNWSLALPVPLEELQRRRLPVRVAERLGRRRA
jgi:4-alpha-glucanotransferase